MKYSHSKRIRWLYIRIPSDIYVGYDYVSRVRALDNKLLIFHFFFSFLFLFCVPLEIFILNNDKSFYFFISNVSQINVWNIRREKYRFRVQNLKYFKFDVLFYIWPNSYEYLYIRDCYEEKKTTSFFIFMHSYNLKTWFWRFILVRKMFVDICILYVCVFSLIT